MPGDSQITRRDKPEQSDKFIPPPMDPYATYQTPYERPQDPEPNPFIEFRRFADKQLSDIFSGVLGLSNIPKMFSMDEDMKVFRDRLEKDLKNDFETIAAHKEAMREHLASLRNNTYHPVPPAATAAIPPAPPQSSDRPVEETSPEQQRKSTQEKLAKIRQKWAEAHKNPTRDEDWIITTDEKGQRYRINPHAPGNAVLLLSFTPPAPKAEQLEDPKVRWRRGFQNCPELKKYQGETELDVYEAMEDQQRLSKPAEPSTSGKPWASWLSAYGYDGMQKSRKASEATITKTGSKDDKKDSVRPCEPQTYRAFQARRMDPLRNDHEFLPWLILSQYSPLYLANPEWVSVKSAKLHNGCEGGCSEPMHIYSHRHQSASITEEDDKLRASLADKVPWADAFEDLLSLERTGKMPNREAEGRVHPRNMTSSWIRDMIQKGLLGPKWWVENGEIRRDSRNDPVAHPPFLQKELGEAQRQLREQIRESRVEFDRSVPENEAIIAGIVEKMDDEITSMMDTSDRGPRLDTEMARRIRRSRPEQVQPPVENITALQQAAPETNHLPIQSASQEKSPMPTQQSSSDAEAPISVQPQQKSTPAPAPAPKVSVISTLTTKTSRTLSDGSIETRRVLKKRFADGKEESEESTEVVHPQLPASTVGKISVEDQKKQGWFWT